jgi:hypothetical protein
MNMHQLKLISLHKTTQLPHFVPVKALPNMNRVISGANSLYLLRRNIAAIVGHGHSYLELRGKSRGQIQDMGSPATV